MSIPTENVGSLPRPMKLQEAIAAYDAGQITHEQLSIKQDAACKDSIERMEATGSPIVSDGEQRASSFATYPLADTLAGTGLADNLAGDGQYFAIFDDGHHRQLPRHPGHVRLGLHRDARPPDHCRPPGHPQRHPTRRVDSAHVEGDLLRHPHPSQAGRRGAAS